MEELITFIAQNLVDHPEDVKTVVKGTENDVTIELSVHPDDMGKIIGKQGRMAKALRTIVKAAAVKEGKQIHYNVEII
ncbi:KH domain-containing protein [Christensenella sp. MSJ-20]|uniref:KH domain-containing protein n=1 Tax=Christensenella sp. MSJ-20 TaxID=2841518 RepID=UPI001C77B797|nr:KH domain-containing protein [Christensenella sp. MSJ-20]